MSPEQAMGEREITARSDVYALGCVLYEMLVGEPPFTGPTAQAIVAKVMTAEPAMLTQQRRTIPPGIEAAVLTALEKLPADRFATAAEFAAALANPMTTTARTVGTVRTVRTVGRTGVTVATVATVALIAGLMLGGRMGDPGSVGPGDVVRATLSLGDSVTVRAIGNLRLAMAPSGRRIAFIGPYGTDDALWVRDLDRPGGSRLADTKGAFAPFFSPDGQSRLGQLALASFTNPGGLQRSGQNLWAPSSNSGEAIVGLPNSNGRGSVSTGTLEGSNVDLAQQFINVILAQRGFQSSSRVITAGDQMLQDLVNIIR